MKSRVLASLLALSLTLAASPVVPAQTNNVAQTTANQTLQDWQGLRDLAHGKKILVEFKSGNTLDGKLVGISGSTLTLSGDGNTYSVEQRDIQRVYRLKGISRKITMRIGLAIGLVGGAIIGGRAMDRLERNPNRIPSDADEIPFIAGLGIGTFAGAGLGWLLGGKRKSKLLYEAK